MDSPHLDRVLRLKTNSVRGGAIEHVYMRKVAVGEIADAVLQVDLFYEEGDKGEFPPSVHDIEMRGVTCRKSARVLDIRGYPSAPVRDVRLVDCVLENVTQPDVVQNVEGLQFTRVRVNGLSRTE
jgi:polygalacturonase